MRREEERQETFVGEDGISEAHLLIVPFRVRQRTSRLILWREQAKRLRQPGRLMGVEEYNLISLKLSQVATK